MSYEEIIKEIIELLPKICKYLRSRCLKCKFRKKFNKLKSNTSHLENNFEYIRFITNINKDLYEEKLMSNEFLTKYNNSSVLKANSHKIKDKDVSNFCKYYLKLDISSKKIIMGDSVLKDEISDYVILIMNKNNISIKDTIKMFRELINNNYTGNHRNVFLNLLNEQSFQQNISLNTEFKLSEIFNSDYDIINVEILGGENLKEISNMYGQDNLSDELGKYSFGIYFSNSDLPTPFGKHIITGLLTRLTDYILNIELNKYDSSSFILKISYSDYRNKYYRDDICYVKEFITIFHVD